MIFCITYVSFRTPYYRYRLGYNSLYFTST